MELTGSALPSPDSFKDKTGYDGLFPSHLISPEHKNKAWHLKYFKSTYYQHKNNQGYFSNERKADWIEAAKYAEGNQDVTKYIKWSTRLKNKEGNPVSVMDLNWKIVSPIPKFVNVLKGYFSKLKYKVSATAINPEAALEREKKKAQIWASKVLKPFFQKIEAAAGQSFGEDPDVPFEPETKEELDLFFSLSFRLQQEIAMEMGQRMVFYENAWDEIASEIWDDIIRLGCLGCCCYVDRIGKRIKLRYCDPINMVIDNFRGHSGNDMERIGEFQLKTIAQIKLEAGSQFTEEEYYTMAKLNRGVYGNAEQLSPYSDYVNRDSLNNFYPYDNFQVLVLELYWDSCDTIKHEKKTVKGVEYLYKKPYNTKIGRKEGTDEAGNYWEKEVYATDVKTVYGGIWLVGSDYIYNWGKINDISRPKENRKETFKPMKFYRISEQSVVELMIPWADSIQMSWLKMQNLKARAIPKGFMIEVGAFENLVLDGNVLSSREALEVAVQSGIIMYRRNSTQDEDGYDNAGKPIEETAGGLGKEFQELRQAIIDDINMCREVSGISELFDASQQNPKQLVGTAQLAISGTQNAVSSMVEGFVWMHKCVASDVGLKLQLLAKYKMIEGYAPALGSNIPEIIKIGDEISPAHYGIEIDALPTEEEKQELKETASAALKSPNDPIKGGIDFKDYLTILRFIREGNLKLAEAYFAYKIQQFKKEQQQISQQNIKAQGEQNMQLEKTKSEEVQKTEDMKTKMAMAVDDNRTKNEKELLILEYTLKGGLEKTQSEHRVRERKLEPTTK